MFRRSRSRGTALLATGAGGHARDEVELILTGIGRIPRHLCTCAEVGKEGSKYFRPASVSAPAAAGLATQPRSKERGSMRPWRRVERVGVRLKGGEFRVGFLEERFFSILGEIFLANFLVWGAILCGTCSG